MAALPAPVFAGGFVIRDVMFTLQLVDPITGVAQTGATATDFSAQVKKVTLDPDQDVQTYQGSVPIAQYADVGPAMWTLSLDGLQDHKAARGLAAFLRANNGSVAKFHHEPRRGFESAEAYVRLMHVTFGGETGSWAEFSKDLPVIGQPAFTESA